MLENESTDQSTSTANDGTESQSSAPPARRRRRAASRPAGPPVTAETDEPGEVRSTAAAADPIFDAPWSASSRSGGAGSSEPRALVSDPFAVPAIDVTALRPPRGGDSDAPDEAAPDEADQPVSDGDAKPTRSANRTRSGGRSRTRTAAKSDETKPDEAKSDEAKSDEAKSDDAKSDETKSDEAKSDEAKSDEAKSDETKSDEAKSDESQAGDDSESDDQDGDGSGRRRRRRRGGRRRRRGSSDDGSNGSDEGSDSSDESGSDDTGGSSSDSASTDSSDSSDDSDGESSSGRRRRRRRRRRSGEDADETARRRANEAVTGIDGSTRLEAKRQRRREGREAGRRRAPILSEAEFLARRESVRRTMVIRQREAMAQIAVLEDNVLVEHYVDHSSTRSLIGNVYLGKVQNVLPSMEAAFIDIGQGRNAVLYAGEIDWDVFDTGGNSKERKIESVLKSGQTVLVQVTKDPIGQKGARLTHNVSLPGRYIVYSPGGHLSGISRKLPDTERKRLKKVLADHVDESASVIVRTAAEGASEDELVRDVTRLKAQWQAIEKKVKSGGAPQLLHAEPDPTVRIVRDLFTEDFAELVIAGNGASDDAHDSIMAYVDHVAPHLADRVKRWDGGDDSDVFAAHRIDEQIAKGLERKVHLPSGGSLVIDRTEAMTVIDVNTGKFTGSGGNLEATVTSNNLEAAEEIVRQLRLRDIGGIIVIDFIDMVLPSNRELLLRRLVECLGRDRTRHQVAEVTSLGLVQMTRKRIGTGLGEAFTTTCEHCQGRGRIAHDEPVEVKPDTSNGSNNRGRGRSRGGSRNNNAKSKSESPKTPPRQPLPKVMPPPPPGLARVTGTDDHADENGTESTGPDEATQSAATEQSVEHDAAAENTQPTEGKPEDTAAEPDPVAAAMDALVADRNSDS